MQAIRSEEHPVPFEDPRTAPQKRMFVTDDGRNVLFTFLLLGLLLALWGFCNGMIELMGLIADASDLSRGFIVPLLCFAFVAFYGFMWPKLSGHEGMRGVSTTGGH